MSDIINLLPDSVANQIAAGEVIQRPASVVKELLENSIDANASFIKLIVKDAGKTLVQVSDNGSGMSETDARMCFERHATSKIQKANDLFSIQTMGFRGEAMASIAAIAHVHLKTKRPGQELGVEIKIEGTEIKSQEICATERGTSLSIRNLFYNVPARRKFLKSNNVESRHVLDEFQRVALAYPEVGFSMHHNDNETYHLDPGSFRQRVVSVFGKNYNERLVPVEEETNIAKISGFICKPEFAKKSRGEQFFYVNNRFIRSTYLNHAVSSAFKELIPNGYHPGYFLRLTLDPEFIDINIHPTKTEVKFEDEKSLYAIMLSAIRLSIGKFNISPSIDFDRDTVFDIVPDKNRPMVEPVIKINETFNPFDKDSSSPSDGSYQPIRNRPHKEVKNWESLYQDFDLTPGIEEISSFNKGLSSNDEVTVASKLNLDNINIGLISEDAMFWQLKKQYIVSTSGEGLIIIHQQRAHQRVLFEQFMFALENQSGKSQQLLFPETVEMTPNEINIIRDVTSELKALGFDIGEINKENIIIHGLPSELTSTDCEGILRNIIQNELDGVNTTQLKRKEDLANRLAYGSCIKTGKKLDREEIRHLIQQLKECQNPLTTLNGKKIICKLDFDELDTRFD